MPALLEPSATANSDSALEMLCAADYPAEEVRWLWPGRIPIGKVTLLVGDPGNGKSLIALDIAARISRGTPWPDQPKSPSPVPRGGARGGAEALADRNPTHSSPGSVLILSSEDDIRDTIRPRLDAAGADPQRVFILPSIADLRHDLEKLRAALDRLPDCRLIVIDPMNSYVGPGDSHFHTVVRRVFEPLAKLAAERGIAVLAVSHLRKHDGAAIQRAAGSMGFVAAARAVWTVCRDPVQADRYLMLQVKNNFVAETAGLAYSISSTNSGTGDAPAIIWQDEPVTASAVEVLQQNKGPRGPEPAELTLAMDFVRQELVSGPKPAVWMYAEGTCGGFSERTARRALVAIGGKSRKDGPSSIDWEWYLPGHDFDDLQTEQPESANAEPTNEASPLGHRCEALVGAAAVPETSEPDPSENLASGKKPEKYAQQSCPTQAQATPSEAELHLPPPLDEYSFVRTYPPNRTGSTRKLWPEKTWALLTRKNSPDRILPFEFHLAQTKLMRILKSRCRLGGRKRRLKRVEIDLLQPHSFRHPTYCRAP